MLAAIHRLFKVGWLAAYDPAVFTDAKKNCAGPVARRITRTVAITRPPVLALPVPRPAVLLGRSPQEDRPVQLGDNLWPGLRAASLPDLSELEAIYAESWLKYILTEMST